jgi:hypothetical protein
VKHLIRNSIPGELWCGGREDSTSVEPAPYTYEVSKVDCDDCLMSVLDLAEEVRERRGELLDAKEAPRCECRPGAHPARENYLRAAAERDGAVCKLGWSL